jgi:hypothetical protein
MVLAMTAVEPDGAALSLADLPAYRQALLPILPTHAPDRNTSFAEIWPDPAPFRGRVVRVEGVVVRRFEQPAVGQFPALTEVWIEDGDKNSICATYPTVQPPLRMGDRVRFTGTFLKMLSYRADVDRLAPLIVGATRPEVVAVAQSGILPWELLGSRANTLVSIGAAAVVIAVLATQFARRPVPKQTHSGPAPEFVDGAGGDENP